MERQISDLETTFDAFHTKRSLDGLWRRLVRRESPEQIPPNLAVDQDGIDFQSPDPEKAILDHIAICMLNPPVFDVHVPGEGQKYREIERDQLLVKATWFNREVNPRRRWERRVYEGEVRDGIKVEWLRPKPVSDDYEMTCPNYFQNTVLDGNFWLPEHDEDASSDAHWYRYSVPIVDSNIKRKDGSKYSIDAYGAGCWLGADEPHDYETVKDKKVDVYVRDARDLSGQMCPVEGCHHPQRLITIYVCPKGVKFSDKAEVVETFPSPFPGSSFFIIGGHTFQTERDPDKIYRPLMYPMYVLQAYLNMFFTWWMVLAVNESSDRDLYANASQSRPENLQALGMAEGGTPGTVKVPQTGADDEMPVLPYTPERLPKATSLQLAGIIRTLLDKMQEYMPNRFQMGVNYTEASNATASANLAALQQSGIPYSPLLDECAGAIDKWDRYTDHQIKFNDIYNPEIKYYAAVTDDENLARYRSTVKRGEQVFLDVKKCVPHDLIVSIANKTYAEQQAEWYLANSKYMSGVYTVEDLIKAAGIFDVEGQQRRLFKGQVRQSLQPLYIRMMDLLMTREASVQSGYDFGNLLQQVEPQEPRVQQSGTPSTQAANTAREMNPTVSLPAMSNPSGGSGGAV